MSDTGPPPNAADGERDPERIFLVVVDRTVEHRVALAFACRRARHTGGRVALLHVVQPADFQHWAAVKDLMEEESREDAEAMLNELGENVQEMSGKMPLLFIRQGVAHEELFSLLDEEPGISIVVLAASSDSSEPGPLIDALTGKLSGRLHVPLTIVPGSLTDEQVNALA